MSISFAQGLLYLDYMSPYRSVCHVSVVFLSNNVLTLYGNIVLSIEQGSIN